MGSTLRRMRITFPSGTAAEVARPRPIGGGPPHDVDRGLVLIPDIGGLRPLFDEQCQWLANESGSTVVAFEIWPDHPGTSLEWRLGNVREIDHERLIADVQSAADATDAATVGVLGFCMGGMFTFQAAGTGRFHRAVPFYGMIRIPDAWSHPALVEPLKAVRAPGACPVLTVVGTADPYTPPADVADAEAAGVTVVSYEGADHGFVHDPTRPSHRADDAADAWRRAIAFLAE